MLLTIKNISINANFNSEDLKTKIPILFLHGFTGCSADWDSFLNRLPSQFTPITIDLIGHGKSVSPHENEYYSAEFQIELLHELIQKLSLQKIILVGYSMGGRLALSFALKHPENILALLLESTSFGINSKKEREERVESDKTLALQIENSTIQEFIKYWLGIPLFASLRKVESEKVEKLLLRKIESNSKIGLSNSLLGFSAGKMKYYLPELYKFNSEVLLIAGSEDSKFSSIANKANNLFPNSELKIIDDCGHNVHFEKPEEFLKLLNSFLLNIRVAK